MGSGSNSNSPPYNYLTGNSPGSGVVGGSPANVSDSNSNSPPYKYVTGNSPGSGVVGGSPANVQPPPPPLISSHIGTGDVHPPNTSELDNYDGAKDAFNVPVENFGQFSFETAYSCMVGADPTDVAPGIPQGYANGSVNIGATMDAFKGGLASFNASPDTWKGDTHNAALKNLETSYPILDNLTKTMAALGAAAQCFSATIVTTRNDIVSRSPSYLDDLQNNREQTQQIKQQYNAYAQAVMTRAYAPNIQKIVSVINNLPAPDAGSSSQAGNQSTGIDGLGGGLGGGGGGGAPAFGGGSGLGPMGAGAAGLGPGAGLGGLVGEPNTPAALTAATDPTTPQASTNPADGMSSAMQGLSGLANPLSQAMNAAQQAGNAGAAAKGLGKLPPPGALNLGPKGLHGGGGAGGGGGGAKLPGPSIGKAASAPATAAGPATDRTVAAGSRAGLSNAQGAGAGAPGAAGAPAGGQHGGAGQGGNHQPSKVLRNKKNGEELIGAAEAVVAVLGEPARTDAAKTGAT